MIEIWKPIDEFNGVFEVSNFGSVRRLKSSRFHILTATKNHRGYLRVCMSFKNKTYARSVHRLVAEAFISKEKGMSIVNHIDGNKINNNYSNLEWTTQQKNHLHALSLESTQRCKYPRGAYQRIYRRKDGTITKVWYAQIVFKNKKKKLGTFNSKREAQLAFKNSFENLYGFSPWRDEL